MSADQPRNRTVGRKMTDSEYERLAAVAEGDGVTVGGWVRDVLLERAEGRKPSVIDETLLAGDSGVADDPAECVLFFLQSSAATG